MGDMTILELVSQSTPFALFILIIVNIVQSIFLYLLWGETKDVKKNVVWQDEFKQTEKRIARLESNVNGMIKK